MALKPGPWSRRQSLSGQEGGLAPAAPRTSKALKVDALLPQLATQLHCILEVNRVQTQCARTLEVHFAVIDKYAFVGCALRDVQDQAIDSFIRFPQTQKTGTEKHLEVFTQIEMLDSIEIQFQHFIVEGGHEVLF